MRAFLDELALNIMFHESENKLLNTLVQIPWNQEGININNNLFCLHNI